LRQFGRHARAANPLLALRSRPCYTDRFENDCDPSARTILRTSPLL